jgi:hypothetical protein
MTVVEVAPPSWRFYVGRMADRSEYASALGYLAMTSASLEQDVRTLLGILIGPPHGTAAQILLSQSQLHGLCDTALKVARLDFPDEISSELASIIAEVKSWANKRNDVLHSTFLDSTDHWDKASEIVRATYQRKTGSVRIDDMTPANIGSLTEEGRRLQSVIRSFAFGRVLPLSEPEAATPHTEPLSDTSQESD